MDTPPDGRTKPTPAMRAEAKAMSERGMTQVEIAQRLDVTQSTVQRSMSAKRRGKNDEREAAMSQLRNDGWTYQQIGDKYGVTKQTVAQIIGPRRRAETGHFRHFNLSQRRWDALTAVASDLGLRYADGSDSGRGNISLLLDAIASGDLTVHWVPGREGMDE